MPDVIQLGGFCPLCNSPIEPQEQTVVDDNQQTVHANCWAESQEPGRNNSY